MDCMKIDLVSNEGCRQKPCRASQIAAILSCTGNNNFSTGNNNFCTGNNNLSTGNNNNSTGNNNYKIFLRQWRCFDQKIVCLDDWKSLSDTTLSNIINVHSCYY